jgi:hypothetical protein
VYIYIYTVGAETCRRKLIIIDVFYCARAFFGVLKIWLLDAAVIIWAAEGEDGIDLLILSL